MLEFAFIKNQTHIHAKKRSKKITTLRVTLPSLHQNH